MSKRFFDLCVAFLGLMLLWPVMLLAGIAIKLQDGGPMLFRQSRVGQGGRLFFILKLRSMTPSAPKTGLAITASQDPRVTPVGRWLRASKLDELPQLWNVLCGDMSFVGPRPEVPKYVALYTAEQRRVLELRPGITDEASIKFRDEEKLLAAAPDPEKFYIEYCIPHKIALNLAYAEHTSTLQDLKVIFRTLFAVCFR